MITAIMFVIAQAAPTPSHEPNPPISKMRQIGRAELRNLIPDTRIIFGSPSLQFAELYYEDGTLQNFQGRYVSVGTYTFKANLVCTVTPHEVCRKLYRDRRGGYYFVNATDTLQRPWRIKIERLSTLPAVPFKNRE